MMQIDFSNAYDHHSIQMIETVCSLTLRMIQLHEMYLQAKHLWPPRPFYMFKLKQSFVYYFDAFFSTFVIKWLENFNF